MAGVIAVVGDVVGLVTGDATGTEDGRVTEELVTGDGVAVVVDSGAAAVVLVPSIAPAALKPLILSAFLNNHIASSMALASSGGTLMSAGVTVGEV